jgi:hypothetical protein
MIKCRYEVRKMLLNSLVILPWFSIKKLHKYIVILAFYSG